MIMLSFTSIKKYSYSIMLFGALFYSVPAHSGSQDTPLAQTIIAGMNANVDANIIALDNAIEQGQQAQDTDENTQDMVKDLKKKLVNQKATLIDAKVSLPRAFKFKDIALSPSDQTPIKEKNLIKHFDIARMFAELDSKTVTFFGAVACEDMVSNPAQTLEQRNQKREIIEAFLAIDTKVIEHLKKILIAIGQEKDEKNKKTLEMMILSPKTDLLKPWMGMQKTESWRKAWMNKSKEHLMNQTTLSLIGAGFFIGSQAFLVGLNTFGSITAGALSYFSSYGTPQALLAGGATAAGIFAHFSKSKYMSKKQVLAAWAASAGALLYSSTAAYPGFFTQMGTYAAGVYAGITLPATVVLVALPAFVGLGYTAHEQIQKWLSAEAMLNCEKIKKLQEHISNLADLIEKNNELRPSPVLKKLITQLKPITTIDPFCNEKPAAAAISIVTSMYGVAQLDAYIALADLVRGDDAKYALVKYEDSPIDQDYLKEMSAMFQGPGQTESEEENKEETVSITPVPGVLTITLQQGQSPKMFKLINSPVFSLFRVHYMAQALGIVSTELKDNLFRPVNFHEMVFVDTGVSYQGKKTKYLNTIRFKV